MADEQIIFTEKVRHPSSTSTASIWVDMREVYEDPNSTKHRDLDSQTLTSAEIGVMQSDIWKNYSNNIDTLAWPNETISYIDDNYNKDNPAIDITSINFTSTSSTKLSNITYDYLDATIAVSENNDIQIQSVVSTPADGIFKYDFSVPSGATVSNPLHILPDTIENYNNNIDIFSVGDIGLYGKVGTTNIHGFNFVEKINNQQVNYYEQELHSIKEINQVLTFGDNETFSIEDIIDNSWEEKELSNNNNHIIYTANGEVYYDTDLTDDETGGIQLSYDDYFSTSVNGLPTVIFKTINNKVSFFPVFKISQGTNPSFEVYIGSNNHLYKREDDTEVELDTSYNLSSEYNYLYYHKIITEDTSNINKNRQILFDNYKKTSKLIPNYIFEKILDINRFSSTKLNNSNFGATWISPNILTYNSIEWKRIQLQLINGRNVFIDFFVNLANGNAIFFAENFTALQAMIEVDGPTQTWSIYSSQEWQIELQNAKEIYTENVNGWYINSFNGFSFNNNNNNIKLLPINEVNILNKYNIDIQNNIFRYKNIETNYRMIVSYEDFNSETHTSIELWGENDNFLTAYEYDTASLTRNKLWILNNTPLVWETTDETPRYFIKEENFNFNKQFINFIKKVYGRYTINYNFGLTYGFYQYTFIPERKIRYYSGDNTTSGKTELLNVGSSSVPVYIEQGEFKPLDNFDLNNDINFELLDGSEDNQNNIDTYGEFDEDVRELTVRFDDVTMINELQEIAFNTQNAASHVLRIIDVSEEGEGD